MKCPLGFLLLSFLLSVTLSYEQLDTKKQYLSFLESHSSYPIFQLFYNRHFRKSRQFQDFKEIIEEVENKVKDYAKIVFTDCDEAFGEEISQCQHIQDNNENRFTLGLKPNTKYLTMGDKLMQRSPHQTTYNHPSDVYTVAEVVEFIEGLVPTYLREVVSMEEYEELLVPRYSPKMLYFTKEDEAPLNIRKLSTIFTLRLDMARVEDLSEELVRTHKIKHFPTLLVLKYNYVERKFEEFRYSGPHFDTQGYLKMKEFLKGHALEEPRNDLLFHTIKMERNEAMVTVETKEEKEEFIDRTSGFVWIEESQELTFLPTLQSKYQQFFSYLHIRSPNSSDSIISLYDPELETSQLTAKNQLPTLRFVSLNHADIKSNMTFFLHRNYSLLVVSEEYGYLCSVTKQKFFLGLTMCLVADHEAKAELIKQVGEFDYGIVCYQSAGMQKGRFTGRVIQDKEYKTVYKSLEEAVKVKMDSEVRQYMENPIIHIKETRSIIEVCADPRRKCAIAFLDPSKTQAFRVEQGYLKDVAQQHYSDYRVFWVDASCNKQLLSILEQQRASLITIDPIKRRYQSLRQRITKSILLKYLKTIKVNTKREKQLDVMLRLNECLEEEDL